MKLLILERTCTASFIRQCFGSILLASCTDSKGMLFVLVAASTLHTPAQHRLPV